MSRPVYLVGTIPLTRPYDVFVAVADLIGERIARVPDGEIGDRRMWIQAQYPVLVDCQALEPVGLPPEGLTRRTSYQLPLRLKSDRRDGDLAFGALGYARYAKASYGIFRALKQAGRIPRGWRFQVGLPAPMDVMAMIHPDSRADVEPAYEAALLAELAAIQSAIPHEELAITWDVVQGMLLWERPDNPYVTTWFAEPLSGVVERFARLGAATAPGVELGYHLCYGSQDHKHALEPANLGASVRLTNALAAVLSRRIDYMHYSVPRGRSDDAYFAALNGLRPETVGEVYLGLIHYTDGVPGARARIAAAARYLPKFGIACECGFGRRPSDQDVMRLLGLHAEIAA